MREALRHDEVTRYELGRYITASEGYWRIYDFPIQSKYPSVEMLALHLQDEQVITFNDEGAVQNVAESGPPAQRSPPFSKP